MNRNFLTLFKLYLASILNVFKANTVLVIAGMIVTVMLVGIVMGICSLVLYLLPQLNSVRYACLLCGFALVTHVPVMMKGYEKSFIFGDDAGDDMLSFLPIGSLDIIAFRFIRNIVIILFWAYLLALPALCAFLLFDKISWSQFFFLSVLLISLTVILNSFSLLFVMVTELIGQRAHHSKSVSTWISRLVTLGGLVLFYYVLYSNKKFDVSFLTDTPLKYLFYPVTSTILFLKGNEQSFTVLFNLFYALLWAICSILFTWYVIAPQNYYKRLKKG